MMWSSAGRVWQTPAMDVGPIIIAVALVIVMPVGILMSMVALAGTLGGLVGRDRGSRQRRRPVEPNEYLALENTNPYDT
ncbi:MAG: hypothetical protein R2695_06695 [Acidimicrobiales bacterium]